MYRDGQPKFKNLLILSFLIFFLIYGALTHWVLSKKFIQIDIEREKTEKLNWNSWFYFIMFVKPLVLCSLYCN